MDCPDQLQYLTRHELMLLAIVKVAFSKMSKSSANKRWWIVEQCLEILRPLMDLALSAWNNNLERTSKPMMKRKGKIGSPCLKPLSGEMHPKGLPFNKKEKEAEMMHNLIQFIQIGLKPSLPRIARMKFHSILSKAFSISNLRNIKPYFSLLCLKVCRSS